MDLDLTDIINRLDVNAYYAHLGINVTKRGKQNEADCPFCGSSGGHFSYHPNGLFNCFKCSEKGNSISLTAKMLGKTNGEAVAYIKQYLGIEDAPWEGGGKGVSKVSKPTIAPATGDPAAPKSTPLPTPPPELPSSSSESIPSSPESSPPVTATPEMGSMGNVERIYDRFLELAQLLPDDREGLKRDRGFSDQIIDELKFRSGGNYLEPVIAGMRQEFHEDDLVRKGILARVNGVVLPNIQLLTDKKLKRGRYLIPYLDEQCHCIHLRPHKMGFSEKTGYSGYPVAIYSSYLLKGHDGKIILTEGEFKAAALYQMGIPALAIPGISSFAKKHFERLTNFLSRFKIRKVVVMFDSEEKGEPNYPNYKAKIEERFDTEFYSYLNAYNLQKGSKNGEGGSTISFETYVAILPADWRVKGKVDFDMALAMGKTKSDILQVMKTGKPPGEYLSDLPEMAKRTVQRKLAKEMSRVPIKREFNKYIASRGKEDNREEYPISNFVINIKASFHTEEGIIRHVEFVNEFGERSASFQMDATIMAGINEFKKFCFNKGNFVFEGSAIDLNNIWKYEFLRDSGEVIFMPDRIGKIKSKLWLFGNLAVHDGKIYRPDDDGIVWINGDGYKAQGFQTISGGGEAVDSSIPVLVERKVDIKEMVAKFHAATGGYEAETMIGWAIATLFSDDIFKEFRCFPILFAYGKRESGKTTAMRWLSCFFGKEEKGFTLSKTTTQNFIIRALAYRGSLATWFDEFRNKDSADKSELFRSVFNRQVSGKGTNSSMKTKGFAVNSTMAISGEETPVDNALFTRCVHLQFSSYKRGSEDVKEWMDTHCEDFSAFSLQLILEYERYRDQIVNYARELKRELTAKGVTDRTAENWAIVAGAYSAVVGIDPGFIHWIEATCQEIKRTGEQEHMLNQFLEDVYILWSDGELGKGHVKEKNGNLCLWFAGCYDKWSIHYRKKTGKEAFEKNTILKYLQDEPYYIGQENHRIDGIQKKAHVLKVADAPEIVQDFAKSLKESSDPAAKALAEAEEKVENAQTY